MSPMISRSPWRLRRSLSPLGLLCVAAFALLDIAAAPLAQSQTAQQLAECSLKPSRALREACFANAKEGATQRGGGFIEALASGDCRAAFPELYRQIARRSPDGDLRALIRGKTVEVVYPTSARRYFYFAPNGVVIDVDGSRYRQTNYCAEGGALWMVSSDDALEAVFFEEAADGIAFRFQRGDEETSRPAIATYIDVGDPLALTGAGGDRADRRELVDRLNRAGTLKPDFPDCRYVRGDRPDTVVSIGCQ